MEENKKVNPEETEAKENDCKLNNEELEEVNGGRAIRHVPIVELDDSPTI